MGNCEGAAGHGAGFGRDLAYGMGVGQGLGQGFEPGCRRGGKGRGFGPGFALGVLPVSPEEEKEELTRRAECLEQALAQVRKRIDALDE